MAPIDPLHLVQAYPALAVAIVFLLDGLGLPLLPEVAVIMAYFLRPGDVWWALALLALVVAMEVIASLLLYGIVRYIGLPKRMERLMASYSRTLLVADERLLLLNRVIPVLPMSGAFVHVRGWRPLLSFSYIALGSFAKYGLILLVASSALAYFQDGRALVVGFALAAAFLVASWSVALRRWWVGSRRVPA